MGINHTVDNSQYSYGFEVVINRGSGGVNDLFFYRLLVEYDRTELTVVDRTNSNNILLKVEE